MSNASVIEPSVDDRRKWQRFIPLRLRSGGGADAVKLGGGTAVGQAFGAIAAPIITRLYTPSDLALVGLIVSFVTFASVGLSLRYDVAIVTALDEIEADILLSLSLLLVVFVSGIAAALLSVFIGFNILSYGALPLWSVSIAFVILTLMGVSMALRYWYVRRGGFGLISRALVLQGAGRASVSISAGLLHFGWVGLLAGEMVGRSLGIRRLLLNAWPAICKALKRPYAELRSPLVRNRKYPAIVLPSSLLDSASAVISVPIVIGLFGRTDGGQFFLIQNMLGLPGILVANSVADVLHAKLANAYLKEPVQLPNLMRQALLRLTIIASIIYIPIGLLSPLVVKPLLGAQWGDAGVIASLLIPVMITGLIVNPASRVLVVVNRPERKLIVDVLRLTVPPTVLYLAYHAQWAFMPSLIGYSLAMAGCNLVYILIVWQASLSAASEEWARF